MSTPSLPSKIQLLAATLVCAGLLPLTGCRICGDCEDLAYAAYGGSWQRTSRYEGRVGSVFDSAGGKGAVLVDRDKPPSQDELQRKTQDVPPNLFGPDSDEPGFEKEEPRSDSDQPPIDSSPMDQLRGRKLEDIREEKEEELRNRKLDDINMEVNRGPNPNRPVTTALKSLLPFRS